MANLPPGNHILSDSYARLLEKGRLPPIRNGFSQRVKNQSGPNGLGTARKELAAIAYGPTQIPLFNFLLQLTILKPSNRPAYLEISRFLALEARVPVDSADLSGTSPLTYSISTKPFMDIEFAEIMLEAGAEVNRRNRYGCTAAHDIVMASDYSAEGKRKTVKALKWFVEKCGDLDIKCGDGISPRVMGRKVAVLVPEMRELLGVEAGVGGKPTAGTGKRLEGMIHVIVAARKNSRSAVGRTKNQWPRKRWEFIALNTASCRQRSLLEHSRETPKYTYLLI